MTETRGGAHHHASGRCHVRPTAPRVVRPLRGRDEMGRGSHVSVGFLDPWVAPTAILFTLFPFGERTKRARWPSGGATTLGRSAIVAVWDEFGSCRGLRGGSFNNNDNNLHAANGNNNNPTNENNNIGFRVAEAPETQAAQACGLIRAGGTSSSGRAVLRDHPVVRRVR